MKREEQANAIFCGSFCRVGRSCAHSDFGPGCAGRWALISVDLCGGSDRETCTLPQLWNCGSRKSNPPHVTDLRAVISARTVVESDVDSCAQI